jgi:hypothetical protein
VSSEPPPSSEPELAAEPAASEASRRRALPLVLIAIATLLAFLAIFAVWANRQLLDTDNWTETSSELLENEAIREQISVFLVDELYANVDVQARIAEALPARAQPLAGPAASGLRGLVENGVTALLGRPRPQELWEQANRRAHTRFLDVVEDRGEVVSTAGGTVTLDLKSLLGQTQERVGIGGRAEERIPEGAGQIEILRSDQLELVQDGVRYLKAIGWLLVILALGLYALAVFLAAGWRREALRAAGIGFVVAGGAALVARNLAGGAVVDSLASTESVRAAAQATWSISTELLVEAATAMVAYGVVMVLAAWIAGPTRLAVGTRRALAPYLREPRYAYGGLAVIVLLLLLWGPTPATRKVLPALLLIALLAVGVEVLRRQTAREFPDASIEESMRRMRGRLAGLGRRGGGRAGDEDDRLESLERLAKLRDAGLLDAAELEREKARLLAGAPTATPG